MKKILALVFVCLMTFSLFACEQKSDLEKFFAENKDTFVSELKSLFGPEAEVSAKVKDNCFVFEVKEPDFSNPLDAQKEVIKERIKAVIPSEEVIKNAGEKNEQLKELENYIVIVKNSAGELIAEVKSVEN